GSWSVSGGLALLTADNNEQMLLFETGFAHHAIDIGVDVVDDTASGSNASFIEVLTDASSDAGVYNGCGVRVDPGQAERELFDVTGTTFHLDATNTADKPTVPGTFRIFMIQDPGGEVCHIPGPTLDRVLTAGLTSLGNEHVGILGRNITVKIRYVALYHF
ncbi:MAG TPA: hypothetical protein VGO00_14115, partial [Kofleriaceae bacterium]|nr:hypothetical protein [Kofleriaceae bacterium]